MARPTGGTKSIWIRVDGMPQLESRLRQIKAVPKVLLGEIQDKTVEIAREIVPVKTGKTRRTIAKGHLSNIAAQVTVGGAGRFLEVGTRPHQIRPRNARALRFKPAGRARYIYRARVNHPGQEATPFLAPAAERAINEVIREDNPIIEAWNRGA